VTPDDGIVRTKRDDKQLDRPANEGGRGGDKSPETRKDRRSKSPEMNEYGSSSKNNEPEDKTEIKIGSLTTTNASDIEILLDQRNEKIKEGIKNDNPTWF